MGSQRKNKGKTSGKNRVWDEWQRYVKKETQRLKQKSGGNVVQVKFTGRQPVKPPEEPARTEAEHPAYEETEHRTRVQVEGVPREEAVQVSDDYIGRTVRPFTVDDYRRIRPMNLMGGEEVEAPYIPEDIAEEVVQTEPERVAAPVKPAVEKSPSYVKPVPVVEPDSQKHKKKKGRKKKDEANDGELELFGSVSEHQVMTRQRLTRKNKVEREELIEKLLDPVISLDEAATLIGVCKTTVRRYTNRGELECLRTPGQQRRFKLSQVLEFVKKREDDQKSRRNKLSDKPA